MPDKQKVTLYLSDDLHRQFKIRSAVDGETMSSMAQRAIEFYLNNAETVERYSETYGQTHQVHNCPKCSAAVTLRNSELLLVGKSSASVLDELENLGRISGLRSDVSGDEVLEENRNSSKRSDEGELITC